MAGPSDEERTREEREEDLEQANENTPLLPREPEPINPGHLQGEQAAENSLRPPPTKDGDKASKRRWPSILALLILCLAVLLIMIFAFFAPSVVEKYATEAANFEPTSLSIDSFTSSGIRARIRGDFMMDASRVEKDTVRNLGRLGTWIAREVETGESEVEVSLPEYGNVVLGTAHVPSVKVNVRNGRLTHVDVLADLEPGNVDGIRRIANDWIDGRLGELRILGKASVPLKSGLFSFGTQKVTQEVLFAGKDVPSIPAYDIKKLNFHEGENQAMEADVTLVVENDYPLDLLVPSLAFQVLVEDCHKTDPYIPVADALTEEIHVRPKADLELNVTGVVKQLPDLLTQDCPGLGKSPLDVFLRNYMRGEENIVYVRGSPHPADGAPQWVTDLLAEILVPIPLRGRSMGHLIKSFSLEKTHFGLPDPFASPDSPEANPSISAEVQALVALPEEMNFYIAAKRVRADADVYYNGTKLGSLDLHKWQAANSTRIKATPDSGPALLVRSEVKDAPLNITDDDVFTDVLQALLFGRKSVELHIKADVSVEVETTLGQFKVRDIPAEGSVPIKPISTPGHGGDGHGKIGAGFRPKIRNLQIIDTSPSSLTFTALVNITNPTNYSATVPYVNIHIVKNGSLLGHATARDLYVEPGENGNMLVKAVYAPLDMGGRKAKAVGRELLSQYISGYNTTLTLQTHAGTIPAQPSLGEALAKFPVEISTPSLRGPAAPGGGQPGAPDDPDGRKDEETHFIRDATMHLITSSATFTLLSPLRYSTLFVENINATALYKGEDVGRIEYDLPFAVPPIDKDGNGITTPRLPVDWSLGSVGYEAVKNALGGTLKLAAEAQVGIRLDRFRETIWFKGGGIGAHVRL